jgi:hypothetical protein
MPFITGPRNDLTERVELRCTREELDMMRELGKRKGLATSALLRMLVHEAYDQLSAGEERPAKKGKKK